ncbi:zinc finger protein ZAT1-like [Euphorbia lathyris]|uniref:zinc finger protein ZAT1-like n=1 Tax=Euphorbia lathyris TaxID=212925 RepID=UPI00331314BE
MEQQDHETKHVCKFCNESFLSGRILGGHMRNHLGRNSAKEKVKFETCDMGIEGYGLRENPKKSWKSSDFNHTDDTVTLQENVKCSVCGKQFGSPRSLHGHMRHHSIEERNGVRCKECGKGFRSLRSLTGHMRLHSGKQKIAGESMPNLISMTLPDSDTVSLVRKKRSNRMRYKAKATPNSSFSSLNESVSVSVSVSDFENEQEVEEVAMCLMLLSRGLYELEDLNEGNGIIEEEGDEVSYGNESGRKKPRREEEEILDSCASDSNHKILECSDCNEEMKVIAESEVPIESEIEKGIAESEESHDLFTEEVEFDEANWGNVEDDLKKKKNEFECRICKKKFGTYQALGGHQTVHRTKSIVSMKIEGSNETIISKEDAMEEEVTSSEQSNKRKEHKCHICYKNFETGQALGGHKRAHTAKTKEEQQTIIAGSIGEDGLWFNHESLLKRKDAVISF